MAERSLGEVRSAIDELAELLDGPGVTTTLNGCPIAGPGATPENKLRWAAKRIGELEAQVAALEARRPAVCRCAGYGHVCDFCGVPDLNPGRECGGCDRGTVVVHTPCGGTGAVWEAEEQDG